MKKTALVCVAVFCVAALAPRAQASGAVFKAGFSLARIQETSAMQAVEWKELPFVTGGLAFESGWGVWGFELDVFYVQQGGKFTVDAANGFKDLYHYIQVPAQIKINIVRAGLVRPFVGGGVYGAYLIKATEDAEAAGVTVRTNVTADFSRWDWGLLGSAGLVFKMPDLTISVEARYNDGLTNILNSPVGGDSVKTRCWMALVGIKY